MEKTKLVIRDNGSILVKGDFEIIDADGNVYPSKPQVSICRCGYSQKKPFCDGAHKGKFEDACRAPQPE
ncbi:CDGSH iron-sulfur domain-containing protein [Risungbinella massiliensis]|uniref:CDGSH iron-sulfur domain-containing protein n=1 Tax=Risungbinella massiliensis TaxID=1329796 RepID=UPI0005CBC19B|nr:CDGSH iron-sulfur domain-containing protein [Risungbinella massiliensis]